MSASTDILVIIDARIAAARDQMDRLEAARTILRPRSVRRRPRRPTRVPLVTPEPVTVYLPPVTRPAARAVSRLACVDDVLALVCAGLDNPAAIARRLDADPRSALARLEDLSREGLVRRTLEGWVPRGSLPNWVEDRARELRSA